MADINVASGSQVLRTYIQETEHGTAPTGAYKTMRVTNGVSLNLKCNTFQSNEKRADAQVSSLTYGVKSGEVSLPVEWSYGSFDDFIEAVMGGTWSGDVLTMGTTKRTFTIEEKHTDIGLMERMTGVELASFSIEKKQDSMVTGAIGGVYRSAKIAQTAGVNLTYDATAKTITRSEAGFTSKDGWAVGDSVVGSGNGDSGNNNTTPWVITTLTDTVMTFTTAPGIVTASSASGVTLNLGTVATSVTAPTTTIPFDSFTGDVVVDGISSDVITGWSLNISRPVNLLTPLGYDTAQGSSKGVFSVTGQISAYFEDESLRKKFINGISTALSLVIGSDDGSYTFDIGTVWPTSADKPDSESDIIQTFNFTATYTTADSTTVKITRAAA